MVDRTTQELVRRRAALRCEYCRLPQSAHPQRMPVDHVVPRKHGGSDDPSNLALSCTHCNAHKGSDLVGIDATTGSMVALFNPRAQVWAEHFEFNGPLVVGKTSAGRVTIAVLQMNRKDRMESRHALMENGEF